MYEATTNDGLLAHSAFVQFWIFWPCARESNAHSASRSSSAITKADTTPRKRDHGKLMHSSICTAISWHKSHFTSFVLSCQQWLTAQDREKETDQGTTYQGIDVCAQDMRSTITGIHRWAKLKSLFWRKRLTWQNAPQCSNGYDQFVRELIQTPASSCPWLVVESMIRNHSNRQHFQSKNKSLEMQTTLVPVLRSSQNDASLNSSDHFVVKFKQAAYTWRIPL